MEKVLRSILNLSQLLRIVAGAALTFMMLVTVADVGLRVFKRPITGAYELVFFAGAVMVGFAIPYTQWARGHIRIDFAIQGLRPPVKNAFNIFTRLVAIGFFATGGLYLIKMGISLRDAGEVSATLKLPFYPIPYGLGFCFFSQCLVLFAEIVKIAKGEYV